MKTKIALTALISILLISSSHGLQSDKVEFQIQTEKQKTAIYDMVSIGTAVVDHITDYEKAPDQEGKYDENSQFYKTICPFYIKNLPIKDPWGNNYLIYCGKSGDGHYGISECAEDDMIVVCLGKDRKIEDWEFDFSDPEAGIFKLKALADFDNDLIFFNGNWIRAPEAVMDSD